MQEPRITRTDRKNDLEFSVEGLGFRVAIPEMHKTELTGNISPERKHGRDEKEAPDNELG